MHMKVRTGDPQGFEEFWAIYPRRQSRVDAVKAWRKLNPSPELITKIREALAWQVHQVQWVGEFIPLPASWLRAERWTDEQLPQKRGAVIFVNECPHNPTCQGRSECQGKQHMSRVRL